MPVSCRLWVQGYNEGSFRGGKKDVDEDDEEEEEGAIYFYFVTVLCTSLYSL